MSLENRVAVITGATGSLGPTVCRAFAGAGARLVPVGTSQEKLNALVGDLALGADQVHPVVANLLEPESVAAMVKSVQDRFGRLDIWLHMVGGYKAGAAVPDFALADLRSMLEQHLHTTLTCARAMIPVMKEAGWGRIVAMTAVVGQTTPADSAPYNIGKAAQDALINTIANELKGTGVTANSIVARTIQPVSAEEAPSANKSDPSEIAAAMLWLCSDQAGATNGARIPIYGRA